jgi:nitronate monooxygenase/enoyl-[acyl-carrier protein] reductase II
VIRTEWVAEWEKRPDEAAAESERLLAEIMSAVREGRTHEILPFTGQTAGLIEDVEPAAKIVKNLVAEAERAVELG